MSSFRLLCENGLLDAVGPDSKSQWEARLNSEDLVRQKDEVHQINEMIKQITSETLILTKSMPIYLVEAAIERYP
jgi:hypothetical protein